jgi:hypothetical protein
MDPNQKLAIPLQQALNLLYIYIYIYIYIFSIVIGIKSS